MITRRGTFRLLGVTTFLVLSNFFAAPVTTEGAENVLRRKPAASKSGQSEVKQRQIQVAHAKVRSRIDADAAAVPSQPRSMVAKAAYGEVLADPPVSPLDGNLVKAEIQQVGFLETHGCGPVCDCGNCDAACGVEPVCGTEFYGDEPACGFEVGCGVGAALTKLGPRVCNITGCDGCVECAEAACGVEGIIGDPGCGLESGGQCGCDACMSACDVGHIPLCLPFVRVNWNRFQFFVGMQGFKGPLNFTPISATNANLRSGSGSFGFYQGFNESRDLKKLFGCDLAAQLGLRATQTNLTGSEFTRETRHQIFLTAGLFRRVDCGLQYGAVVDYLNSDWYFQGNLTQLRSELSWKGRGAHVWGFQNMARLSKDNSGTVANVAGTQVLGSIRFRSTTQYRFFYRRLLNSSGQWDTFLGFTDNDDGLLGSTINLPLRRNLVLQTGGTFLVPREGSSSGAHQEESWNISLGLMYRPGGPMGCGRYCRPMFDVADNGTFMVDFR